MIYFLGTIYFWKVSDYWLYFPMIGYAWNVISVIALIWIPESPRYLIAAGRLDEARKAFETGM